MIQIHIDYGSLQRVLTPNHRPEEHGGKGNIYTCIYIYIERDRYIYILLSFFYYISILIYKDIERHINKYIYIYIYIYMGMRPHSTTTPSGERTKKKTRNNIPRPSMISKKIRKPWVYHWAETWSGPIGQVQISSYYLSPNFVLGVRLKRVFVSRFAVQQFINIIRLVKNVPPVGQHKSRRWVNIKATSGST